MSKMATVKPGRRERCCSLYSSGTSLTSLVFSTSGGSMWGGFPDTACCCSCCQLIYACRSEGAACDVGCMLTFALQQVSSALNRWAGLLTCCRSPKPEDLVCLTTTLFHLASTGLHKLSWPSLCHKALFVVFMLQVGQAGGPGASHYHTHSVSQ